MVLALLDSRKVQNMDAQDLYGRTPLLLATRLGLIEIVFILLSKGSSAIHTAAHSGCTPFSFVSEHKGAKFGDWRDETLQRIWLYIRNPEMVRGVLGKGILDSGSGRETGPMRVYTRPCDVCNFPVSQFEEYLFCANCQCQFGSFSICGDCVARGSKCKDSSHVLIKKGAGE
jgi:hypothetical protein